MAGDTVVLVHGLWMNGLEFGVLGRRLRDDGFDVHTFSYPSLHGDVATICRELAQFAAARAGVGGRVHLAGHSLGGVLVYRALTECAAGRIDGNAVLLGAPLNGSRAARGAARWPALRGFLGPHVIAELVEPPQPRCWDRPNALGVIAGTLRMGSGQFFARFDEDNDGTVAVSETRIPGLTAHLTVPHSHMGMLFAADVARQVSGFLRSGRFEKQGTFPYFA